MQKVAIEGVYLLNSIYIFTMMVVIKIANSQKHQNQPTIVKTNQADHYFKMFNTQIAGPIRIPNRNITK
uniref:Uncharacterized protein n=1 Tax=Acrobeloides nanus TaxID=290746 RepID=A0A914D2F4_9BILA